MNKKVVIWGYPPHTHTHSYIHLGFAKAFSSLDYDVVWYDDDEEYSDENLSDSIIISEINCCRHLPIDKSSKYFIHNIQDDFIPQTKFDFDNVYNLLVYHEGYRWDDTITKIDDYSWYDSKSKTSVIMWATDLLPDEIDEQDAVIYDDSKPDVNYVGSLSIDYRRRLVGLVQKNNKQFKNYGGYSGLRSSKTPTGFIDDRDSIELIKQSYLNFDLRPQQHLDNGYIPCRVFKTMSYGCWVGTNSEKISSFLGNRLTVESELSSLYSKTEEDSKNATSDILIDNKNYIRDNHTYINRVNSLLSIL